MSNFNRFIDKNKKRTLAADEMNGRFVFNGYPTTTITCGEQKVTAAVVNKQEQEKAYIYTDLQHPLDIGSVWTTKGLHFLIVEEIVIIKDVQWKKYIALLCNVLIDDMWCYFKGSEKAAISTSIKEDVFLNTQAKPVLVSAAKLGFRDKIIINNRAWVVMEWDNISTQGIVYCTLEPTTISKEIEDKGIIKHNHDTTNITFVSDEKNDEFILVKPNIDIIVPTEKGYIKASANINIKSRTSTEIIFSIPYGVENVLITTLQGETYVNTTYVIR